MNEYFASKSWLTKYAQAEDSRGMWQKHVDEVEANRIQDPRPMDPGPRNMYSEGQLVRNTDDGSRPGYSGRESTKKLRKYLSTLKPGTKVQPMTLSKDYGVSRYHIYTILEEYPKIELLGNEEAFKLVQEKIKAKTLATPVDVPTPISKIRNPGDKGGTRDYTGVRWPSDEVKANYIEDFKKKRSGTKTGHAGLSNEELAIKYFGKINTSTIAGVERTNRVLQQELDIQYQEGDPKEFQLKRKRRLAINQGGKYFGGTEAFPFHHIMPIGGETSLTTKDVAIISKKMNSKLAPYNKKLNNIADNISDLYNDQPENYLKKIDSLHNEAESIINTVKKDLPSKYKGLIGFTKLEPVFDENGTVFRLQANRVGIDESKSIVGKKGKSEVLAMMSKENTSKFKGGILKILQDASVPCIKGEGGQCNSIEDYKKGFNDIVNKAASGDKAAVSRANIFLKRMRKLKPTLKGTGYGILAELGFSVPFAVMDYTAGESWKRIGANFTDYGFGPMFGPSEEDEIRSYLPEGSNAVAFENVQKTGEDINKLETGEKIPGYSNLYNKLKNRPMTGLDPFSLGKFDEQSKQNKINKMTINFEKDLQPFLTNGEWDPAKANQAAKEMEDAKAQKEQNKQKIIEERKASGILAEDDYLQNMKKYND